MLTFTRHTNGCTRSINVTFFSDCLIRCPKSLSHWPQASRQSLLLSPSDSYLLDYLKLAQCSKCTFDVLNTVLPLSGNTETQNGFKLLDANSYKKNIWR